MPISTAAHRDLSSGGGYYSPLLRRWFCDPLATICLGCFRLRHCCRASQSRRGVFTTSIEAGGGSFSIFCRLLAGSFSSSFASSQRNRIDTRRGYKARIGNSAAVIQDTSVRFFNRDSRLLSLPGKLTASEGLIGGKWRSVVSLCVIGGALRFT